VDKNGFRLSVRRELPEGETLPIVNLTVLTAPFYKKETEYIIHTVDLNTGQKRLEKVKTDHEGRLTIHLNGGLQEVGINESEEDKPNIVASVNFGSESYSSPGKDISLQVSLLNKGSSLAEDVTAKIIPAKSTSEVEIKNN